MTLCDLQLALRASYSVFVVRVLHLLHGAACALSLAEIRLRSTTPHSTTNLNHALIQLRKHTKIATTTTNHNHIQVTTSGNTNDHAGVTQQVWWHATPPRTRHRCCGGSRSSRAGRFGHAIDPGRSRHQRRCCSSRRWPGLGGRLPLRGKRSRWHVEQCLEVRCAALHSLLSCSLCPCGRFALALAPAARRSLLQQQPAPVCPILCTSIELCADILRCQRGPC